MTDHKPVKKGSPMLEAILKRLRAKVNGRESRDGTDKRAVLEQQAADLSKAEFEDMLDAGEDVPDDLIPF